MAVGHPQRCRAVSLGTEAHFLCSRACSINPTALGHVWSRGQGGVICLGDSNKTGMLEAHQEGHPGGTGGQERLGREDPLEKEM